MESSFEAAIAIATATNREPDEEKAVEAVKAEVRALSGV
jgi:hypothetical protein